MSYADSEACMLPILRRTTSLLGLLVMLAAVIAAPASARSNKPLLKYINLVDTWDAATARTTTDNLLNRMASGPYLPEIEIGHPDDGAVFPPNMASPHFFWKDAFLFSDAWLVVIETASGDRSSVSRTNPAGYPKNPPGNGCGSTLGPPPATLTVIGVDRSSGVKPVTRTQITFSIASDPFDGVLFF